MAETILVSQHPCIMWEIKNIFSNNCVESDVFYLNEVQWKLDLYIQNEYRISIRVRKITPDKSSHEINVTPLIKINNEISICKSKRLTVWDGTPQAIWYSSVSDVLKESKTLCRIFYFLFTSVEIPPRRIEMATSLEQLSTDFSKLFNNEEGSDVILKCGEEQIRAHKHILTARSDVFAAMFRSDMSEPREGVVVMEDMTPEILDKFIRYIYTGNVGEITMEETGQLYEIADKYGIGSLRNRCASFMAENLSETVACDFLLLAETHGDEELKNSVIAFMANRDGFLNTEQWSQFSEEHAALAVKIYKIHCVSKSAKK